MSLQPQTDPRFVALRYMIPAGHRSEVFLDFTLTLYFHTETLLNNSIDVSALSRQRVICVPSALWAVHEAFQSRKSGYSRTCYVFPQQHSIIPSSSQLPGFILTVLKHLPTIIQPWVEEQPLTVITAISHPT